VDEACVHLGTCVTCVVQAVVSPHPCQCDVYVSRLQTNIQGLAEFHISREIRRHQFSDFIGMNHIKFHIGVL